MTNEINGHDVAAEQASTEAKKPDNLELVTNVDQFMQFLRLWHDYRLKVLRHLAAVPEGITVGLQDEPEQLLEGDFHKGFVLGMKLAIAEISELPFHTVETVGEVAPDSFSVEGKTNGTSN